MFKIGDFSKICRVPASTLRYYADLGLLEPALIDRETGYRYFELDQLIQVNRILALKEVGLSLDEIRTMLEASVSADEIKGMLRLRETETQREITEAQNRLLLIQSRLRLIQQGITLATQEIALKAIEAMTALTIRQRVTQPEGVADLLRTAASALGDLNVTSAPFTIFYDPEFKEADLDIEIAIPVQASEGLTIPAEDGHILITRKLEAVNSMATLFHVGNYDTLAESYATLGKWIDTNGYQLDGAIREVYLRPPDETEPALTEIQFPIVGVTE